MSETRIADEPETKVERTARVALNAGRYKHERDQALAIVACVRALLTEPQPPHIDSKGNFLCMAGADPDTHRTVGPHRAWCHNDSEWCYPRMSCPCCEPRLDQADVREALGEKAGIDIEEGR